MDERKPLWTPLEERIREEVSLPIFLPACLEISYNTGS